MYKQTKIKYLKEHSVLPRLFRRKCYLKKLRLVDLFGGKLNFKPAPILLKINLFFHVNLNIFENKLRVVFLANDSPT